MEWEGKRDLYEDDYRQLIQDVWNKYSRFDSYSSSGGEEFRLWIEHIILHEADRQKKAVIQIKKAKIKNMREEIKRLEEELPDYAEKDGK